MDVEKWPRKLLVTLYRHRWDIETSFREMKILDSIESFHSRSAAGVRQEIAAYMIARLLTGMLMCMCMKNKNTRIRWNNDTQLLCNHQTLVEIITDTIIACAQHGDEWGLHVFRERVKVAEDATQKKRPGRFFELKCKGRYGRWVATKNNRSKYV